MTILRMYYTPDTAQRPTHYREAWWDDESNEFVLHHGKVGERGTTTIENVATGDEADLLLASFAEQNATDQYLEVDNMAQETFTVLIHCKSTAPTQVERSSAEKFATEYTALLAWRGLGSVDDWDLVPDQAVFAFHVSAVHGKMAAKYAPEALKKTEFRADRMKIERN